MSHKSAFIAIAILGIVVYSNTFHAAFHYDDFSNFAANREVHIQELSIDRILDFWWLDRPLALLTFGLNYYLGGLNVEGYHAVNIGIHIMSGILLYLFLYETIKNAPAVGDTYSRNAVWIALLSAMMWISNPVQIQAVTYIVQRMTSMASLFYILALLLFVKGRLITGIKRWSYWVLSLLSFFLSLCSKEIAVTLPLLIAVYEVCLFKKRGVGELFKGKAVYLLLGGVAALIWIAISSFDLSIFVPRLGFPLKERIYTESRVIIYYITLLLFPLPERMSLSYDFPLSRTLFVPFTTWISMVMIAGCLVYSIYRLRKHPLLSFFILWFLITISAESLVPGLELVFEHRLYFPSMAFFPLLTISSVGIWKRKDFYIKYLIALVAIIILAFSVSTYKRNSFWIDGSSIYADSVRKYPNSLEARMNMGVYYLNKYMADEAIEQFERAKDLNPRRANVRWYLGNSYYKKGEFGRAAGELEKAIELGGKWFEIYGALGDAYTMEGELEKAEIAYQKAIDIAPDGAELETARAALESVRKMKMERRK